VDAVYRRVAMHTPEGQQQLSDGTMLYSGCFTLNLRSRTLQKNGRLVDLTQIEFQIMEYMLSHRGQALTRTAILNDIWGEEYAGEEKIVDVNIRRLRMKIEDEPSSPRYLATIWGVGYKWIE